MVDVNNDREPGSEGQTIDKDHPLAISPARISHTRTYCHDSYLREKLDLCPVSQMPLLIIDVPRKCCYQVLESASERGSVS